MKYIYITSDLMPTYDIQEELSEKNENELTDFVTNLVGNMLHEFAVTIRTNLDSDCAMYWLLTNESESVERFNLPNAEDVEPETYIEIARKVLSYLNIETSFFDDSKYMKIAFTSESNDIWDYSLLEVSSSLCDYVNPSFYVFGFHPEFEDTIVTQGYSEGEFDTGILNDFDVDSYGGEDILRMLTGVSSEMFNDTYYQ